MTPDLQPMCALTFGSMLIYHIIASRLVYIGLYCYFITSSSADCLYIIIYIGDIADCLNLSLSAGIGIGYYRLSAGTTPSACQPIGCFDLLFAYLVSGRIKLTGTHASHHIWTCTGAKQISQAGVLDFFVNTLLARLVGPRILYPHV